MKLEVRGLFPEISVHKIIYENCTVKDGLIYLANGKKYCSLNDVDGVTLILHEDKATKK